MQNVGYFSDLGGLFSEIVIIGDISKITQGIPVHNRGMHFTGNDLNIRQFMIPKLQDIKTCTISAGPVMRN